MPTRTRAKAAKRPRSEGRGKGGTERKRRSRPGSPATASRVPEIEGILFDEGLTPAQLRFVEELCANPTMPAVHAARMAYPNQTEESLRVTASENLAKPNIRAAIARRLSPTLQKTRASKERSLQLLGDSLNADKRLIIGADGAFLPFKEWPPEIARLCTSLDHEEIRMGRDGPVIGRVVKARFVSHGEILTLSAKVNKLLNDPMDQAVGLLEDLVAASRKTA